MSQRLVDDPGVCLFVSHPIDVAALRLRHISQQQQQQLPSWWSKTLLASRLGWQHTLSVGIVSLPAINRLPTYVQTTHSVERQVYLPACQQQQQQQEPLKVSKQQCAASLSSSICHVYLHFIFLPLTAIIRQTSLARSRHKAISRSNRNSYASYCNKCSIRSSLLP